MDSIQLQNLFTHLESVITWRVSHSDEDFNLAPQFNPNDYKGSHLGNYISEKKLTHQEVVILLMALLPRLDPSLLKRVYLEYPSLSLIHI